MYSWSARDFPPKKESSDYKRWLSSTPETGCMTRFHTPFKVDMVHGCMNLLCCIHKRHLDDQSISSEQESSRVPIELSHGPLQRQLRDSRQKIKLIEHAVTIL